MKNILVLVCLVLFLGSLFSAEYAAATTYGIDVVASPGNQAANGENKHQPKYREKPVYSTQDIPILDLTIL